MHGLFGALRIRLDSFTYAMQSACLQRSLGEFLGRLSMALATFQHPAAERQHEWSMDQVAPVICARLPCVGTMLSEQQK